MSSRGAGAGASSENLAVSVRGLGKEYRIGAAENRDSPLTLTEKLVSRMTRRGASRSQQSFWAMRDVSFDVGTGEVVGIIGRNGAGKSTLLKLLSRITEPTEGQIDLWGRVGSLLEVGTGFHPELTGRENIFLNGAILGMTHREIQSAFDAIVDFSGVEVFLETPVKRYSSGMYVRLAFAVAAHLNPEILIVDEVLAVGDAEFQAKCLGKMQDVARGGRTVLFVSHHMQSVRLLCDRAILLDRGRVAYDGAVAGAISHYLGSFETSGEVDSLSAGLRPGSGEYRFEQVTPDAATSDSDGEKAFSFRVRRTEERKTVGKMYLSAHVVNSQGVTICQCDSRLVGRWWADADIIEGTFRFRTPWLAPGLYRLDVWICTLGRALDEYEGSCRFEIAPLLPYANTASVDSIGRGVVLADFDWSSDIALPSHASAAVSTEMAV